MEITKLINGTGTTYVANGTAQYDLGQIAAAAADKTIGGEVYRAYVKRIRVEAALTFNKSDAGTAALGRGSLARAITGVRLKTPERTIVELPSIGGRTLAFDQLARLGTPDPTFAAATLAASTDTAVQFNFEIGFDDKRFGEFADQFRPLAAEFAGGASLSIIWPAAGAAGIFGATVSLTSASTLTVYADVVYERVLKVPSRRSLREIAPSGTACALTGLSGTAIVDFFLHPIDASGVADRTFSAANLSGLSITQDGTALLATIPGASVVSKFNSGAINDTTNALSTTAMTLVPVIAQNRTAGGKLSQEPISAGPLDWVQAGSAAATEYKFSAAVVERQGPSAVADVMRRLGIPAKAGAPDAGAGLTAVGALLVPQKVQV